MTRQHNKKSVGMTVVMALLVVMALEFTDLSPEDAASTLVHEFGELLDGVEAEILSISIDTETFSDTTDTMQTEKILSEFAYLQAFDEVIRKQIL